MSGAPRSLFDLYVDRQRTTSAGFHFIAGDSQPLSMDFTEALRQAHEAGLNLRHIVGDRGRLVAILAGSQADQTRYVLACLSADLVPAVLAPPTSKVNPSLYAATLRGVLARIAPALVVTDRIDLVVAADTENYLAVYDIWTGAMMEPVAKAETTLLPDTAVMAQFSSGTTGLKKGVTVSFGAMVSQLEAYGRALEISHGDRVVSWLPLYHDMGYVTALHLSLYWDMDTVMIEPFTWLADPAIYLEAAQEHGATLGWNPNFAYSYMAGRVSAHRAERLRLDTLRSLANCSEPVTNQAQRAFIDRFASSGLRHGVFSGCYAMAETTFALTSGFATDTSGLDHIGPEGERGLIGRLPIPTVGTPLEGVGIEVRDVDGQLLDNHTTGELWVTAPFLSSGYIGDQMATGAAFVDGWYRTGDLGYRIGDNFYVLGRVKDTMIIAGENVYPEDVERIISEAEGVRPGRVVAFAVFDERSQTERVAALAEPLTEASGLDFVTLRQRLLAEVGVAVTIEEAPPNWLVKSSSGKIARNACRQKWQAARATTSHGG